MDVGRKGIIDWVATEIMPHEGSVRARLRRARVAPDEIDDLIQEAYCKLLGLDGVEQISRPDSYFFQVARNLLVDKKRRTQAVRIDAIREIEALEVASGEPSPEQIAIARRELKFVQDVIRKLPDPCLSVINLRKVEGVPQREIAHRLGISESAVENAASKGMRLILRALREGNGAPDGLSRAGRS